MKKKIIAIGISALSAAALTFGTVGSATAAPDAESLSGLVCAGLDGMATDLADQIADLATSVTDTGNDVTAKKAALVTALDELAPAVVAHIQAVSDGANSAGTGQILAGKSAIFADKFTAAQNAMTANFEAQRTQYITGLSNGYIGDVQTGLCA